MGKLSFSLFLIFSHTLIIYYTKKSNFTKEKKMYKHDGHYIFHI